MASGRTRVLIILAVLLSAVLLLFSLGAGGAPFGTACTAAADPAEKIPIRVLILPRWAMWLWPPLRWITTSATVRTHGS